MVLKKYLKSRDLFYSCIYGDGIYQAMEPMVRDPVSYDSGEGYGPLLKNVITGEAYFMKRLDCNQAVYRCYCEKILNPPCRHHILWPCDMIALDEGQADICSLFVAQEYSEDAVPADRRSGLYALLFPYAGYPEMIDGTGRLARIDNKNWKNAEVRNLAYKILMAFESVNRSGYIYGDVHLSRVFFDRNDEVYLNFTNLVYSFRDFVSDDAAITCTVGAGDYPLEFADPSIVRNITKTFDFQAQNFSICALLFFLFFGRHPYDGRLLTGYVDDSIQSHYIKFRDYHRMPVFLFDPDDRQNALGAFWEEQQIIDLWEECPLAIRELFLATLKQENAERTKCIENPTPGMWIEQFHRIGWIKDHKREEMQA